MPVRAGSELKTARKLLSVILACAAISAQASPRLEQTANFIWYRGENWFGGFSGAEVSERGSTLTAISDRGRVVTGVMIRTGGILTDLALTGSVALRDSGGNRLRNKDTDAEGLARGRDGQAYVSFENRHRVATLDPATGITRPLPHGEAFAGLRLNGGLEALAIHPDGTLFTLPERSGDDSELIHLYSYDETRWNIAASIPRRGSFLPVGADFDANGLLYLLERTVTPLGFRSRIRRFNLAADGLAETTLLHSLPGRYDNLEALSVWQDETGQTHLTLVSDDNFLPIQRSQIVEFIVKE